MSNSTVQKTDKWYSIPSDEVLKNLQSSKDGLSSTEAQKRLTHYGHNRLPEGKKATLLQIILHQVLNPLIFILVAAAGASIAIGEGEDAIFIFLVIFINAALGTYQEYNAEKSADSLKKLLKIKAQVLRDGKKHFIDSEELVPGDIVFLESGVKVPADLRLLDISTLEVDESFLTGESIPALKTTSTIRENAPVADRINMVFAGSPVLKGRAFGIVTATGLQTEVGKISQNVSDSASAKPPLVLRMERFIKQISIFIISLSIILAVVLRAQGMDFTSIFFFVVAMAVSAIPEGLPVALTVALSIATKRMAKRNVIVRKLTSVESLGSCTIIASDKTGTLTVNEQTAKLILLPDGRQYTLTGEGYNGEGKVLFNELELKDISDLACLNSIAVAANEGKLNKNSEKWEFHGDAMDVALLGMSYKLAVNPESWRQENELLDVIPYESERKFSGAFLTINERESVAVKGALETILDFCHQMQSGDETAPIDRDFLLKQADDLAKQGYRVLAFASGEHPFSKKNSYDNEQLQGLTFHGLVGFIDPLRKEAIESVVQCHDAGIKVLMITGDHPETALTISRQLGIADEQTKVVSGKMLTQAGKSNSKEFEDLVASTTVFARVSPTQKLEIVDVLIRRGEFVAVTGDGVNDAPALKRANIGVAMGSGTDVAKEVGAMIVVDDNFSSIVSGIEEGRFAYDNVRKVIYLLIATGAAEVFLFLASIAAGLPLPILAVQLLWLNLVTNGIQDVALAFEGGEPGAMKRPPRKPSEKVFNPLMIQQTLTSGLTIGIVVFGFWYWLVTVNMMNEFHARNLVLLLMVFMQNLHVFNCRSERISAFKVPLKRNLILVIGVFAAQGIHILSMQIPFMQNILKIEPITFTEWLYVLVLAIPILISMEIFKWIKKSS
jgi:magnesium-transporting ATPase (P-type)